MINIAIHEQIINFVSQNLYSQVILIIAAFYLVGRIVIVNLHKLLQVITSKTKTQADDLIVSSISSPLLWIFLVLSIMFTVNYLEFPESISVLGNKIGITLILIIATAAIVRITNLILGSENILRVNNKDVSKRILPLLHRFTKIFFWAIAILMILSTWQINISGALAGLGIAGIAISFALKDSLANVFGGISLIMDKTFRVGDKVELESGETGRIYDIGLRSTRLRTFNNEIIIIPNNSLANMKIKNFAQPDDILRENVSFSVVYGSDIGKVSDIILNSLKNTENVLEDPSPRVEFKKMGNFSLDFIAKFWVEDYNHAYKTKLLVTKSIYEELNKQGIDIPFPTRTIYMKDSKGPQK